MMKRRKFFTACLTMGLLFAFGLPTLALINPNFTPLHLVAQSNRILLVTLGAEAGGKIPLKVVRAVKGQVPPEQLVVDLNTAAIKERSAEAGKIAAKLGDGQALLFMGDFKEEGDGGAGNNVPNAMLHLSGQWLALYVGKGGVLEMDDISEHLLGTWDGGTDMLLRAVEYVMNDPEADVPVRTGMMWAEHVEFAAFTGKVHKLEAVDLSGKGDLALFAVAENGDKLFIWDANAKIYKDVTAQKKLDSRSRFATWGDFNADGRPDLATWTTATAGKLELRLQNADGTFQTTAASLSVPPTNEVMGLTALDAGGAPGADLMLSTTTGPILLKGDGSGRFDCAPLTPPAEQGLWGAAGETIIADFDGDGLRDALQPFFKNGAFYKGLSKDAFAPGVACGVFLNQAPAGVCLGDFDGDGLPDLFGAAANCCLLWQNLGGGKFAETFALTGEAAHIAQPGGFGGAIGDFNNDGRQDILILYPPGNPEDEDRRPLLFFNRGFRSFGHSHMLDLQERNILQEALGGQQAGVLADLNNDGVQEMALITAPGKLWILRAVAATKDYEEIGETPLSVQVVLPPNAADLGPILVGAALEKRSLGVWNVAAGGPGAFFGMKEAGEITVRWRLPGGEMRDKKILVEDKHVKFVIPVNQ
jgi:hypothetical protein